MARLKMGFTDLSMPAQIERSRMIQSKIISNPNFPFPTPTMIVMKQATDDVEAAYNASRSGDSKKIAIMKLRSAELLVLIRKLAAYVQNVSGGDEEMILSSGFDVVRRGGPLPLVAQVENLRLKNGTEPGSFRALWNKVIGAFCYVIEISEDGAEADTFELYRVVSKTRWDITGLVPGRIYWVRVYAIGCSGYGTPSNVGTKTAEL